MAAPVPCDGFERNQHLRTPRQRGAMHPPGPISFTFEIDDELQLIRVLSAGTWNVVDVERYSAEFRRHFVIARRRFGRVRALVDGRDAVTQDPEVGKRLASLSSMFDQAGDRFAVVTPSSLRKQQASRDGLPGTGMAFLSRNAAETWLFAHDQPD